MAISEGLDAVQPFALSGALRRFSGPAWCHAPADRPFDLAALMTEDEGRDRWGVPGARSIYLAGHPAVALAELARHLDDTAAAGRRRIVRLAVGEIQVADLRGVPALGPPEGPWVRALDHGLTREVGRAARQLRSCQGLLVPSVAFLDRPDRPNLVLFGESLGADLADVLGDPVEVAEVCLSPG